MNTQRKPVVYQLRRFQSYRRPADRTPYGLRQEERLRRGLSADARLQVYHSETEDAIYKMDAIVRFHAEPMLRAVGLQFTTKSDPDKVKRTIAAVRRTRVVSRLLYLEAECPLSEPAFALISGLIRFLAQSSSERGFVCAVLTSDGLGQYRFRDLKCFPLEATETNIEQQKEEKAA